MIKATKFLGLSSVALLAACSSSPDVLSEKLAAAGIYEAVIADGETQVIDVLSDETSAGVTGFMGFEDGTLKPVQIRTNADQTIMYISIDGAAAIELARTGGGEEYGYFSNETTDAYLDYYSFDDSNYVGLDDAEGHYGLEAPVEALAGTAGYRGRMDARGENSFLDGSLSIGVNFDDGTLIGFMQGFHGSELEESGSEVFGGISGVIEGSRMAGVIDINTTEVQGSLDMLGAFYGFGANTLAGGVAGTLNGETLGGEFHVGSESREGPCCF